MEKNRYSQVSDKKLDINNNDTPLQQSLSKKTLKVPLYYKNPFNLVQSSIGKKQYLRPQNEDILLLNNNNASFNKINVSKAHVNINHLLFENEQHSNTYIRCGITTRVRFKEATLTSCVFIF